MNPEPDERGHYEDEAGFTPEQWRALNRVRRDFMRMGDALRRADQEMREERRRDEAFYGGSQWDSEQIVLWMWGAPVETPFPFRPSEEHQIDDCIDQMELQMMGIKP